MSKQETPEELICPFRRLPPKSRAAAIKTELKVLAKQARARGNILLATSLSDASKSKAHCPKLFGLYVHIKNARVTIQQGQEAWKRADEDEQKRGVQLLGRDVHESKDDVQTSCEHRGRTGDLSSHLSVVDAARLWNSYGIITQAWGYRVEVSDGGYRSFEGQLHPLQKYGGYYREITDLTDIIMRCLYQLDQASGYYVREAGSVALAVEADVFQKIRSIKSEDFIDEGGSVPAKMMACLSEYISGQGDESGAFFDPRGTFRAKWTELLNYRGPLQIERVFSVVASTMTAIAHGNTGIIKCCINELKSFLPPDEFDPAAVTPVRVRHRVDNTLLSEPTLMQLPDAYTMELENKLDANEAKQIWDSYGIIAKAWSGNFNGKGYRNFQADVSGDFFLNTFLNPLVRILFDTLSSLNSESADSVVGNKWMFMSHERNVFNNLLDLDVSYFVDFDDEKEITKEMSDLVSQFITMKGNKTGTFYDPDKLFLDGWTKIQETPGPRAVESLLAWAAKAMAAIADKNQPLLVQCIDRLKEFLPHRE